MASSANPQKPDASALIKQSIRCSRLVITAIILILTACDRPDAPRDELAEQVQAMMNELHADYGFPGATAAYVLADGSFGEVSVGFADQESATAMAPSSRMLAASIGKTFVSAAVLALADEELLDLDDEVFIWFRDELWFRRLPNYEQISIRHLLTHTSGIANHVDTDAFASDFANRWADQENFFAPEKLVSYVLDLPSEFQPGQGWSYTDTGYVILGLLVERVSGQDFYEFVDSRFLAPLALNRTSPSNQRKLPGLAAGYMHGDNPFGLPARTTDAEGVMLWNPAIEWTGGGFISSSLDLARWGKALLEGNAMDGTYLDELLREAPVDMGDPNAAFGAGIAIKKSGPVGRWYGHGGWIPGYVSSLRYYPDARAALAFQINTDVGIVDDETDLYQQMAIRLEKLVVEID